jgi:feruloyl-CoA synthase
MLDRLAANSTGSSNRIARAMVLDEPPDSVSGEITDKGSINQRAVIERRVDRVAELYADAPSERVLRAGRK